MKQVALTPKTVSDLQKLVSKINRLNESAKELSEQEKVKDIKFTIGGRYAIYLLELLKSQLEELDIKTDWFTNSNLIVLHSHCEIILCKI